MKTREILKAEIDAKTEQARTLQCDIANLFQELESLPPSWEERYPEIGTNYFTLDGENDISKNTWIRSDFGMYCFNSGNYYPTIELAKEQQRINFLVIDFKKFVWELQGDWEPDWSNENQEKWGIHLDVKKFRFNAEYCYNHFNYYFETSDIAQSVISHFPAEDLKLILKNIKSNC